MNDPAPAPEGPLAELPRILTHSRVRYQVPLHELTTLRIGGPAEAVVDLESEADLARLFDWLSEQSCPYFLVGKGSNLLADDGGYAGVVIRLGRGMSALACGEDGGQVHAGAGLANGAFVSGCRAFGLGGMEFLVAVPGSIGGAIAMNAGAHDGETAEFLHRVRYWEAGGIVSRPAADFDFAYRKSPLRGQDGRVVIGGEFRMVPMEKDDIRRREAEFQSYRRETQPRDYPNCGSVFKNPAGHHAARLIEAAGLKGHRIGQAQISAKHANFIVNRGGASSAEVLELIDLIQNVVYQRFKLSLDMELQILK